MARTQCDACQEWYAVIGTVVPSPLSLCPGCRVDYDRAQQLPSALASTHPRSKYPAGWPVLTVVEHSCDGCEAIMSTAVRVVLPNGFTHQFCLPCTVAIRDGMTDCLEARRAY